VLFPHNSHTYLCLLFCVYKLLLFLSILKVSFPHPRLVLLVYTFHSVVYFLRILLIPDVFHQFQLPCYFLSFLLPFFTSSVVSSSTWLISLFLFLINPLGFSAFSILSKYSFYISAFSFVFIANSPFLFLIKLNVC
jgi:hypothetical protein